MIDKTAIIDPSAQIAEDAISGLMWLSVKM